MAERLKRAAAWLGLVTDDRYAEYDEFGADQENTESVPRDELIGAEERQNAGRQDQHAGSDRAEKSASVTPLESRRTSPVPASHPTAPATPQKADLSRIITVHPRTYNEARTIGEHFRDGVPVIMNLSDMEDVDAKRLVDFAAGLIFGVRGSIERITSKVFLLSPPNVNVTAEDKERIAGGFFNQS